ncbi:MAG: hypothetical protein ACI36W_02740, partial [Coriobacteriales bacterium]
MANYSAPLAAVGLVASAAKVVAAKLIADKRTNFVRVAMRDKAKLSGVTVAGFQHAMESLYMGVTGDAGFRTLNA